MLPGRVFKACRHGLAVGVQVGQEGKLHSGIQVLAAAAANWA
jgi:hypothetical protein